MLNDELQEWHSYMRLAILLGQFNIQHYTFNIVQEIPCPI